MPLFTPPVHDEPMPTRVKPFCFFVQPVSFAVVFRNGHFQSVRTPSQDETRALVEGKTWFTGGRTYYVDADTQTLLQADGFTVDPDPGYGVNPYGSGSYGG